MKQITGLKSQIGNAGVRVYLDKTHSDKHFRGIGIVSDRIVLGGDVTYPAVRTVAVLYV